ncbi:MAG: hypothetical protein IJ905_12835 [Fibrobacter sp.]|nr:hypothetical protein [Fibrobacter sp.]
MKIEKKKVLGNATFSSSAKATIAASLGVAASFALSACISDSSEANTAGPKTPERTCGMVACDEDLTSSSSSESNPSSSSKVIDIPKSYEHYSSSVIEALSSASQPVARPISSSITGGVPLIYSSPTVPLSSYSAKPASSSSVKPSSSNANVEIIKVNPETDSTLIPTIGPTIKDTLIPQIHLCDDPNNPNCHMLIQSMVTTLETDDIA